MTRTALRTSTPLLLLTLPGAVRAQRAAPLPVIRLTRGLVITRSVRIAPGHYTIAGAAAVDSACVTIRGEEITVDFSGAVMSGSAPGVSPDRATGVAILVDGGGRCD